MGITRYSELKRVFIHFGAHKTGTSYLQYVFAQNRRFFWKQRSLFIHPRYDTHLAISDLKKWQGGGSIGDPPKEFTNWLNGFKSQGIESVFISSEGLFGSMNLSKAKTLYPNSDKVMRAIKDLYGEQQVKVAFSIRNYADFIESSYKWKVSDGMVRSFESYIEAIDMKKLSWIPVIKHLIDTFGIENVILWEYEQYRRSSAKIHQRLLEFFYEKQARPNELKYPAIKEINVSANAHYLEANRAFNKAINSIDFLTGQQKRQARVKLRPYLKDIVGDDPIRPTLLDNEARSKLDKKYKKDLAEIEKLYGKALRLK